MGAVVLGNSVRDGVVHVYFRVGMFEGSGRFGHV